MIDHLKEIAGILIAVVLAVDCLLHVYWATGRVWPAPDTLTLSQAVLNSNKLQLFQPRILISLAGILFLGTLIVLARVEYLGAFGQLIPDGFLQVSIWLIAAGFLLIGLNGIVRALGIVEAKSRLYSKLNLMIYTPACFVLFAAAVVVAIP